MDYEYKFDSFTPESKFQEFNYEDNGQPNIENFLLAGYNPQKQKEDEEKITSESLSQDQSNYTFKNISDNQQEQISKEFKSTEDEESTNDGNKNKKLPIIKKGIGKKSYEPILDNQVLYRYEDNPEEYRKARKRIQNRESATRVRYRKKNYSEQLEQEVEELQQKNTALLLANAKLQAENNMLKNQVQIFEKIIMNNNNGQSISAININNGAINVQDKNNTSAGETQNANKIDNQQLPNQQHSKINNHINAKDQLNDLYYQQISNIDKQGSLYPPMRVNNAQDSGKKQFAIFSIALLALCALFLGSPENSVHIVQYDKIILAAENFNNSYKEQVVKDFEYLFKQNQDYSAFKYYLWIFTFFGCVIYASYLFYKNYFSIRFLEKLKSN